MFNAEISAGSLLLPESRRIARLLLTQPTSEAWDTALYQDNLLQKKPATAKRQATLIRKRLETLDADAWGLVADGDIETATQLLLAAAIRHSHLLGEFLRTVYGPALQRLETQLTPLAWDSFMADCTQHDPAVGRWAASTRTKLYQVVMRILAEAKFVASTRQPLLTPPMLHPVVKQQLIRLGAHDTLTVMDFHR
jgi:hypothetical protein